MNTTTISMKELVNFVAKNAKKENKYNLLDGSFLMENLKEYSSGNNKCVLLRWFSDYIPWNVINPLLNSVKVYNNNIDIVISSKFLVDARQLITWLNVDKNPYPWEKSREEVFGIETNSILSNNIDYFLRDFIDALEIYCIDSNIS